MKTKSKALLLTLCAVLLVTASVLGTMAFLTSNDEVVNTFSVGSVAIKLDEAKAKTDGTLVEGAERVKANSYKLLPGHTYNKDPMVTVLSGSEASYIKMTVTFSKASALDAIFAPTGADLISIFNGYDSANWIYKGNTKDATADTRTYEFWYKETVGAPNADVALNALFDSITVPGEITKEQLATIAGMTITVNACTCHLFNKIMACTTLDDIWAAFDEASDETVNALTDEQNAQIDAKIEALEPAPAPAVVIEESDEETVPSEIVYRTVNYTFVAPFGDPVTGGHR